jgi:IS1 family transposase
MNILPRDKQIEIIAALVDGLGQRAVARITGTNRGTVAALALRIGQGCATLHDGMMVGVRTSRIECDELWSYVLRKRRRHQKPTPDSDVTGEFYTYVGLSSSTRAIVSYLTAKRSSEATDNFIQDLRQRVIGTPEISTDGLHFYRPAIRHAFRGRAAHGVINKTYNVTHLAVTEASRRYSPAQVIAVERYAESGDPEQISTSYVERSHLTLRMASKRFARLSNGFSKRIEPHAAAVALHVMHYNFCRVHESLRTTPAMALGVADRVWSVGDLLDAALATMPAAPENAPDRRKRFTVITGGKDGAK